MTDQKIQHVLVLMFENRSFDHMLGYLEYPPGVQFEGIRGREQEMGNARPNGEVVFPGPNARFAIHPGPGHSHDDVLQQLLGTHDHARPFHLKNNGFVANYQEQYNPAEGELAVQCFTPDRVPVLATLAKEFAVCDHWFCSVPGATWPNRNFVHAATSAGQVNIVVQGYGDKTIFEQLSEGGRDWAVYYGGFPPQSIAFSRLWSPFGLNWLQRFKPIGQLYRAIREDRLPHYAFIEPDMLGKFTDSQHPGMGGEEDFKAAEKLLRTVYSTLRDSPAVFAKTLLVILYDEHGGFFDHVAPPQGEEWSVTPAFRTPDGSYTFPFDVLGLRVPALFISPWIAAGTVDHTVYDHASVPATVRKVLGVNAPPLTNRDAVTHTFEGAASLDAPRTDLPDVPEPEVNQEMRHLIQEPDLRPSLMGILTRLIWTELRPGAVGGLEGLDPDQVDVPIQTTPPEVVEREVMEEIAPQLSERAQQVLAEAAAEEEVSPLEGLPSAKTVIGLLQSKVEKLAQEVDLVDDLQHFVDLVLRRYVEGHEVILRTAGGAAVERPNEDAIRRALDELFAGNDPAARVWLADHCDRWLTVYGDGRAELDDQEPDGKFTLPHVSRARAVALFGLLAAGRVGELRAAFRGA